MMFRSSRPILVGLLVTCVLAYLSSFFSTSSSFLPTVHASSISSKASSKLSAQLLKDTITPFLRRKQEEARSQSQPLRELLKGKTKQERLSILKTEKLNQVKSKRRVAKNAIVHSWVSLHDVILDPHVAEEIIEENQLKDVILNPQTLAEIQALPSLSISVALFTILTDRIFIPQRDIDTNAQVTNNHSKRNETNTDFASNDYFPEEIENTSEGLVRLTCPANHYDSQAMRRSELQTRVFESFPDAHLHGLNASLVALLNDTTHIEEQWKEPFARPELYLVPLDYPQTDNPLYQLLAPLFDISSTRVNGGGSVFRYALLQDLRWLHADGTTLSRPLHANSIHDHHPFEHIHPLSDSELLGCKLHFLPEQLQKKQPTGRYISNTHAMLNEIVSFSPAPHHLSDAITLSSDKIIQTLHIARNLMPDVLNQHMDLNQFSSIANDVEELKLLQAEQEQARLGQLESEKHSLQARLDRVAQDPSPAVFLSTSVSVKELDKPALGITKGIVGGMLGGIVGGIIDAVFGEISKGMGQTVEADFSDKIPNELTKHVAAGIEGKLHQTLAESMPPTCPAVAAELAGKHKESITSSLVGAVPPKVKDEMTRTLAWTIGRPLTELTNPELLNRVSHTLVKSLSLSLAPAILHTLEASPHLDYYCHFCRTKNIYCNYCRAAPKHLYYANYYAGYYSTYYANYYTKFAADSLNLRRTTNLINKPQVNSFGEKSELVLPGDETVPTFTDQLSKVV